MGMNNFSTEPACGLNDIRSSSKIGFWFKIATGLRFKPEGIL
jgi:hypothetical protein